MAKPAIIVADMNGEEGVFNYLSNRSRLGAMMHVRQPRRRIGFICQSSPADGKGLGPQADAEKVYTPARVRTSVIGPGLSTAIAYSLSLRGRD